MLMSHSCSLIGRFSGYLGSITGILMKWSKSGSYILLPSIPIQDTRAGKNAINKSSCYLLDGLKVKVVSYITQLTWWLDQGALQSQKWQLMGKSQWRCSANCGHPLHALTYNCIRVMQLANTPPLQSTTPGLHPVSIHQKTPLVRGSKHPITAYYSIYRPRKNEKLSRPGWLVTYQNKVPPPGVEPVHVTHPSTNRARRRVTSLIRPTLLPLRHAATT